MGARINYRHLFYFKVIAEEQSVIKAADKLHLSQPTLSAQLKQFEESLGVPLFERRHKKLLLTEQGKIALDYSRNIFNMGAEMYEVLHDRLKPAKPALCVGALDTIPKQIVLQLVRAALDISRCQITLLEGRPEELLRELSAHRVDLLVTNFIPTALDAKGLVHRVISKKNVSIFGAPRYKALRKKFPSSISGQPMILPTYDSKLRYDIDHWSKLKGIDLDVVVESQDIAVKKLMAVNEIGLLPAATHTVRQQVEAGELIEIGRLQAISEELLLVMAQRKVENTIAKKVFQTFVV